ncbi:MAG: thiamine-phosphate kinase [Steroidobacteraceae bacterium]
MNTESRSPPALGEFGLIDRYFAGCAAAGGGRADVVLGIGDDAALLHVPENSDLVAAVDTLVAGRHFPIGSDARSIGHRALAVNLSDVAAMGATAAWMTLALTLPAVDLNWLEGFAAGLSSLAVAHGVALVGGDTTAGPLSISVQILGHVARGTALRRGGGRAGDILAVTGTLGDAGAGLALLTGTIASSDPQSAAQLIARFEYPTPRLAFGALARGIASAAMDISDGLAGDVPKLAAAGGLAARIDVGRLPLSMALQATVDADAARGLAVAAGDDYELLLAVPPDRYDALAAAARRFDLLLTRIGELHAGQGVRWECNGSAYPAPAAGYDHFR